MQGEQFQVFIWKVHRGIYVSGKEGAKDLAAMKKLGTLSRKAPFLASSVRAHTRHHACAEFILIRPHSTP